MCLHVCVWCIVLKSGVLKSFIDPKAILRDDWDNIPCRIIFFSWEAGRGWGGGGGLEMRICLPTTAIKGWIRSLE